MFSSHQPQYCNAAATSSKHHTFRSLLLILLFFNYSRPYRLRIFSIRDFWSAVVRALT